MKQSGRRLIPNAPCRRPLSHLGGGRWQGPDTQSTTMRNSSVSQRRRARPEFYVPPIHLPRLVDAVRRPEIDPRPWGAYTLGYNSQRLRLAQLLLWRMPNEEYGTADGVPQAVAEMRIALDVLASALSPGLIGQVRGCLKDSERLNGAIAAAWALRGRYEGRAFGAGEPPGEMDSGRLGCLLHHGVPDLNPYAPWFRLGEALG